MNTKGVDVSAWQEGLDIKSIKDNGYSFAILRGGFTHIGDGVTLEKDMCFEDFYNRAKEVDLPVGCYWYSCANTYEKGKAEAEYMYEHCLKGKKFEYPIYIDVEESQYQEGNYDGVTAAIQGFGDTLESKGYYVGIYASLSRFNTWFNGHKLWYTKWIACWSDEKPTTDYPDFGMWQNSSNGNVDGFRIDTDYAYLDFPSEIKRQGLNGYTKEPEPTPTPEPTPEPEKKPYKTFLVKVYEVENDYIK